MKPLRTFTVEANLPGPVSRLRELAMNLRWSWDPETIELLIGLGVRELSMAAPSLPRVKQRIRQIDMTAAIMRAEIIMSQADSGRIAALLDDFNGLA